MIIGIRPKSLAVLLAIQLVSCGAPTGKPSVAESPETDGTILVQLSDFLAGADLYYPMSTVPLFGEDAGRYLTSGWNPANTDQQRARSTSKRVASVDIPILEKRARALVLELSAPPREPYMPAQTVKFLWNGHSVGEHIFEDGKPNRVELKLPASLQQFGLNRLEIMPLYWLAEPGASPAHDSSVGVYCSKIEFSGEEPVTAPLNALRIEDESIVQPAGTGLVVGTSLTRADRLTGRISARGPAQSPHGTVRITIQDAEGTEREVVAATHEEVSRGVEIDVDLAEFENGLVCLTLTVEPGESRASSEVVWSNLQIAMQRETDPVAAFVPAATPSNVLVVLFDTLRADHLPMYGATEIEAPRLSQLATEGVLFTDVLAPSSWTRPSVASLFTGQSVPAHQVIGMADSVSDSVPFLPHLLQQAGYRTLMFTENPQTDPRFGFGRGFDRVHSMYGDVREIEDIKTPHGRADFVWEEYLEPFLTERDGAPYFVFLHQIDPHHPYMPPAPYDEMYGLPYRGNINNLQFEWRDLLERNVMTLEPQDMGYLHGLYKGEISFMDAYLDRLLSHLNSQGALDDTLLVFVSDHGEEFLEHKQITHGKSLHDEVLHVPLIFWAPGALPKGVRSNFPAQLQDVTATILALVGVDSPSATAGTNLVPWIRNTAGDPPLRVRHAHQALGRTWVDEDALVYGRWKLIRQVLHSPDPVAWNNYLLYDTESDASEQYSSWSARPVVGLVLRQMLTRYEMAHETTGKDTSDPELPMTPEMVETLQTLGYL